MTGEVAFSDGLRFGPHESLGPEQMRAAFAHTPLPIPGSTQHIPGVHPSDHGSSDVEAVSDQDSRVQAVLISHHHSFYQPDTPEDSERRAYHERVNAADLRGQRQFAWGHRFLSAW